MFILSKKFLKGNIMKNAFTFRSEKKRTNKRRIASPPHCTRPFFEKKSGIERPTRINVIILKNLFLLFSTLLFHFTSCHRFNVMCVFCFGHRDLIRNDYYTIVPNGRGQRIFRFLCFAPLNFHIMWRN
jgi:hypothetical protein